MAKSHGIVVLYRLSRITAHVTYHARRLKKHALSASTATKQATLFPSVKTAQRIRATQCCLMCRVRRARAVQQKTCLNLMLVVGHVLPKHAEKYGKILIDRAWAGCAALEIFNQYLRRLVHNDFTTRTTRPPGASPTPARAIAS